MDPIALLLVPVFLLEPVEDLHERPASFDESPTITQPAAAVAVEYPLAKQFIPAHPSNYVAGGIDDHQYVIIHTMEGVYNGTISWFQYSGSNVSTHYVMRSSDGELTQMVSHDDMAQHIGGYNPRSFGIEHEGYIYEPGWYTWETYLSSAQLTRWLCDRYDIPIDRDHIVGHVEVPGASHTDPGPYWEWDMYMAMVHDVVPQGRIEGVVVDRSQSCVLTALQDTWVTTTLESLDALDDDEICFLPAGTELPYLHASQEMISQRRLHMEGGGPCAGLGELETLAYIWEPSFSELCSPESMAAAGVTVLLDGAATTTDAEGRFVFEGVSAGAHVLDVTSDGGYLQTTVPIDVDVYPGLRVVIGVEPDPDGSGDSGDSESSTGSEPDPTTQGASASGDEGGETSAGSGAETSSTSDDGVGSTAAQESGTDGVDPTEPGQDDAGQGCGCTTGGRPGSGLVLPMLAVPLLLRRRRG